MSILACGINHKTAPLELREKVVFDQDKLALYLTDLLTQENIEEAVILSTCNRSELYCTANNPQQIIDWFSRQHNIPSHQIEAAMYFHYDQAAIEHIMNVACGLDSMVLGESQILRQMKQAFSEGCVAGSVGAQFNKLFQQVFTVAKEVRTNTAIGACPVSVASAAVEFIKTKHRDALNKASLLVLGAGTTADLVLRHLKNEFLKGRIIVNRSLENGIKLAEKYHGHAYELPHLPHLLMDADIVISATGSPAPLIIKSMLEQRNKPLIIVDIAVPRDVAAEVSQLPNVKLFAIDHLKEIIQKNLQHREHAAIKAKEVIKQKSQEFMVWLSSFNMVGFTIRAYRKQIENLCQAELAKALRRLKRNENAEQVLLDFAQALTNKLLHAPSVQLRQAGYEGRLEILQLAQQLFSIPEAKSQGL